ncbi:MAG: acetyl-CoA/propionyl-CoA carboxylase carboxyl transferase subunit, partial [Frankiales bacterium]|nr:acetyl-CoA/propionyl-CoA carboxylase carboxyl transferase subunit [Frankiales bacterium]
MTAEPLEQPSTVLDKAEISAVCLERLDTVFDDWDLMLAVDGVAVGMGVIHGVETVAFATDPTVQGGALGIEGCGAISDATDIANLRQAPCVGIWHSGGARLREGVGSLDAVGRIFAAQTRASGRVPQISVVLGPAAGGAAYGPALTDVVIMGPSGRVFVTGPDVVRRVTGEQIDMER